MNIRWRKYDDEKPEDGQEIVGSTQKGVIGTGTYHVKSRFGCEPNTFHCRDDYNYEIDYWIPLSELEATLPKDEKELRSPDGRLFCEHCGYFHQPSDQYTTCKY